MNSKRTLLSSIVFLGLALRLIFGWCHGTAASLPVAIHTTGLPAMAGFATTLIGLVLMILATVLAVVGQVRWPGEKVKPQRSPAA